MNWVNQHIEEILNMFARGDHGCSSLLDWDLVDVTLYLNLTIFSIFGYADQVLVGALGHFQVVGDLVTELIHASTKDKEAEQAEDEFVLEFVLLKVAEIIIIFPAEGLTKGISELHAFKPLIHTALDSASVWIDNIKLFKKFEVSHVEYTTGHLFELDLQVAAKAWQRREALLNRSIINEILEELVDSDLSEGLVVAELG